MGAATVSRTTDALAPGYEQETCTVGGVISGYCAIGRMVTAARPASRITAEITRRRTGRSMKNLAMGFGFYNDPAVGLCSPRVCSGPLPLSVGRLDDGAS